ncbi:MAG TPA: hypothetical protein VFS51_08820 [Gemmatimonadales bacterium]|nr:hypothetical protein [Gemmatimonadales bacterium]
MYRLMYLTAVTFSLAVAVSACENRRDDTQSEAGMRSETDTGGEAAERSDTGKLSEADKKAGRTLETPGDSVRLEDTLSIPPASKDTTQK